MTGEGHKDWLSDSDFHPGYCIRRLNALTNVIALYVHFGSSIASRINTL